MTTRRPAPLGDPARPHGRLCAIAHVAIALPTACAAPGSVEFHVAPSGNGAACTAREPCSLDTARDQVRALNRDMQEDIIVWLAGGTYALASPFALRETATVHDSGTGGHDVIYQAEPGARPILSGGTRVTGWTLWDPERGIYRAAVPGLQTRQLYVNGVRAIRARGPLVPRGYRVELATGFLGPDGSLADWSHPDDVEVVGWASWKSNRCPVASLRRRSWHNVVAASTGRAFDLGGDWFAADRLTDAGQGAAYLAADFDGDGLSDLLLASADADGRWHNAVARSTGQAFAAPVDWLPDAGRDARSLVGDFDGDGKADLLLAAADADGRWHNAVARSTGQTFAAPVDWLPDAGRDARSLVGDFDGDGKADLLLAAADADGRWHNAVALSTGAGFAAPVDWLPDAGRDARSLVGDFDGDGKADLLLAAADADGRWHNAVALSTGAGFAAPVDWLPDAGRGATYHVGDFDGDGKADLLLASAGADGRWHNAVARSTGAGFAAPVDWLSDAGHGAIYQIGNFTGGAGDRTADVVFAGHDVAIAVQQPCWTLAHAGNAAAFYNFNTVTWIENALELLDEPGEWYLDRSAGYLYYRPRDGEDLAAIPVVAATLDTLVDGRGEVSAAGTRFLHNLQIRGLTFAYAGWLAPSTDGYPEVQAGWHRSADTAADLARTPGAVTWSAAHAIVLDGNIFTHLGAVGLDLGAGSQSFRVVGNVFRDISSTAIQLGDVSESYRNTPDPARQAADNTIADNAIADVAVEYHSAVGIFVGYSRGTTIAHNDVSRLPYTGISIGWGWGQTPDGILTGCHDSFARDTALVANRVHDVMQQLNDGGGIYTLGGEPGSVLDGNVVSGVGHPGIDYAAALYHDQGSCYYTDRFNVLSAAPLWMSMWQPTTILNNSVHDNYIDIDTANCGTVYGPGDNCNFGDASGNHNTIYDNTITGGDWPAAAQPIIERAGLEPAYRGIAAPVCGDATCDAGETAASCPADCR